MQNLIPTSPAVGFSRLLPNESVVLTMCIILTCEPSFRPSAQLIETCFSNNPDGAGIAWIESGRVETSKGFSTADDLNDAIGWIPDDSPAVIHMRIATSGGVHPAVCHPFPIAQNLRYLHATDVECNAAIAHNGVIPGMPTDETAGISDTISFVRTVLYPLWRRHKAINRTVKKAIRAAAPGSRFAIITPDGVSRVGFGWETAAPGIEASNDSWRYSRYIYDASSVYSWDDCACGWDEEEPAAMSCGLYSQFLYNIPGCASCPCVTDCAECGAYCENVHRFVSDRVEVANSWASNVIEFAG